MKNSNKTIALNSQFSGNSQLKFGTAAVKSYASLSPNLSESYRAKHDFRFCVKPSSIYFGWAHLTWVSKSGKKTVRTVDARFVVDDFGNLALAECGVFNNQHFDHTFS